MIEYDAQHLLLILTFVSIISIAGVGFIIRTLDIDTRLHGEMRYYKLYFSLAITTLSLKFLLLTLNIHSQFIAQLLAYIIVHAALLLALDRKYKKSILYGTGILLASIVFTDYIFSYDNYEFIMIYVAFTFICFTLLSHFAMRRGIEEQNQGYYLFLTAFVIVMLSSFFVLVYAEHNLVRAMTFITIGNNLGIALVIIGFLAITLIREHKKLELLALKDTLTGMNNRRGLQMSLDAIFPLFKRSGKCLSVVTIDLDFFKNINDTYGHDVGDIVLVKCAKLLMNTQRQSDISARLGGEEFVLVLFDTNAKDACSIAEKLRIKIEASEIFMDDKPLHMTASFGIATSCREMDIDTMIKDADKALYTAKYRGRNRVCHIDDVTEVS